jgi:nitroreductase
MGTTRRVIVGGAGAALLGALGAAGYRAWDRGVFEMAQGPAYRPWDEWRGNSGEGPKQALHAAILAANPHDTQPWAFSAHGASISIFADRARNLGSFDPFRREMHLGIGCAVENLMRAASVNGYTMNVIVSGGRLEPNPKDTKLVRAAHLWLDAGAPMRDALYEAIPHRHTNRGPYHERPVSLETLHGLADLVGDHEVRVAFLTGGRERADLADMIVAATARIIADRAMSADSARWFRTGRHEVEAHRDGIGVDTAGLSPLMAAAAKIMPDQDAATADRYWLDMTRDVQTRAPVLGMLLVRDRLEMGSAIGAGRAWQRLHLAATAMGLAAQPLNQPVECIDRNQELGRSDGFASTLTGLARANAWEATFVFRMGYAQRPALPSPRRPLHAVMVDNT